MTSCVRLRVSADHIHAPEAGVGCSVSHPARLAGLPFTARDEAIPATMSGIGDAVAAAPEFRGDAVIDDIPHHGVRRPFSISQNASPPN